MHYMKKLMMSSLFVSVTGCAGIINGTTQDLTFRSEPEGATVLVDGLQRGVTPITLNLKKNEHKTVSFRKAGYKDETVELSKKMDPVAFLNIFWDLSTTDAITGALYEYSPNTHVVSLKKAN